MPDMEGRNLASNLRGIGVEQNNVPEWKQHITGGAKGKQKNLVLFSTAHMVTDTFEKTLNTKSSFLFSTASYGKKTTLSIIEQRQSLPIFKLKEELLKAVHDNQVLIVIGETGICVPNTVVKLYEAFRN